MSNGIIDNTRKPFGYTLAGTSLVVTAGAYTAADVVGGTIVFDVTSAGGGGRITDIYLTDAANQAVAMTLFLFDIKPTAIADNGAWDTGIDIDDLDGMIAVISLTAGHFATTINSLDWAHIGDVDQDFATKDGHLYMYAVCVTGPTYAAVTDVKISMTVLLN